MKISSPLTVMNWMSCGSNLTMFIEILPVKISSPTFRQCIQAQDHMVSVTLKSSAIFQTLYAFHA